MIIYQTATYLLQPYLFPHTKKGPPDLFVACLATQKTLNYPIFIGNSRFFVDLHDNYTVQILMRTVRLCVHLSCNFCCKVLILFLKTFTSLETNESLKLYRCSNFFGYHLKILSNCLFVLSFYILLL